MKRVVFSFTLGCCSIFAHKGILDAYNNIPTNSVTNTIAQSPISSVTTIVPPISTSGLPVVSDLDNVSGLIPQVPPLDTVTGVLAPVTGVVSGVVDTVSNLLPKDGGLLSVIPVAGVLPNINTLPVVNTLPIVDTLPLPDLTDVPNLAASTPILAVVSALPAAASNIVPEIQNVIAGALNKSTGITCYKTTTKDATYFIFVPTHVDKRTLTDAYESVVEFVKLIGAKIQDFLATNNQDAATIVYETSPANIVQTAETTA